MKPKIVYSCQECGSQSTKWLGKCPDCGSWNSLVEETQIRESSKARPKLSEERASPITEIEGADHERTALGIDELDRVLGGGIVRGSALLIGGDPGIGKSTLLMQAASQVARTHTVLYVTGEESPQQLKMRAERLGPLQQKLYLLAECNLDRIVAAIEQLKPRLVIVDSVQMIYRDELSGSPGSVGQLRECTTALAALAKRTGVAVAIIGHVTKEGAIAGPKVLEHIVDAVLYFEGERYHSYRIIRAVKNRYGSTNEIGIFEMTQKGLLEVKNPSALFLGEREESRPGSVVAPFMEGSRTLLAEVQALVTRAVYGTPNRKVSGYDHNRVMMILAVLEKRAGLFLSDQDVYVNVAGGIRITEPAADLAVALSIASSFKDRAFAPAKVVLGEIGLGGELRKVTQTEARLGEAAKLGFKSALLPKGSRLNTPIKDFTVNYVTSLAEALEYL